MYIRFGNLSPSELERRSGLQFTDEERAELMSAWSQNATLTGPEDFHIFDDPTIVITVGSATSRTVEILKAANQRNKPPFEIAFQLDEQWKESV